ncbi:MAG TPA: cytochrome c biogenesis protein CcdA [Bryobacteraceae bacterium]|nr:cytochrome c biogenesis protein CcdA [Bryobacteraceae bacterium]
MRLVAGFLLLNLTAFAQGQQHAAWSLQADPSSARAGATIHIRASVQIDSGWHLYSASSAAGIPASFQVSPATLVRVLQPAPKRAFDPVLDAEAETYEGSATFLLEVKLPADLAAGPQQLSVNVRYQTCNATMCVPGKWTGAVTVTIDPSASAAAPAIPPGYSEAKPPQPSSSSNPADQGLAAFLLVAFGFGLASIFTPCVFPMIPITMSYFLNRQSGGKGDGVVQAVVFCLGIIVLFSGLGLLATAVLGPVGVKQLGSNPWVNGFIAVLFIAFGLSLLGAFEITIPSSILTRLNQASGTGGFAGTLLMGLTFSLSSFACVGPFVGTLLAASVGGSRTRPIFGMLTFATGLALPFFLLALFPSYLKRMPRSGGWLARVKVVMGFIILAASLKYLASLDQVAQWGFLTRERFLAAWIVLFAMAGLYLLGFVRLEGIKPDENMGLGRLLTGMAFLVFALSLVPGMSGGKLGSLDAFVPAGAAESADASDGLVWMKDRYHEALDRARRENKLVFVDFTGYACTNCHWMRANMLARPEIAGVLKDFVLVELYTDGTDAASQANSKLQLDKFGTVAEPYYVILDPDEKLVAKFEGLTHDPAEFLAFLHKAQTPAAPAPAAGGDLPQVTKLEGGPLDTSALAGKVVVVNFWATWCVPCIGELPAFNKLHRDFAAQGVAVIGVSMDEDGATKVPGFLKRHPIDYTVALGSEAVNQKYNLEPLPVTLIYDRTGKQVKRFEGSLTEPELVAAVRQALGLG